MSAAVIERFGPPEVLRIASRPIPAPGPDQLLVRIVAAGVNPVDAQNRNDGSWAGIPLPATLGSDAAGVVVAVGSGVNDFAVGDDVYYFSDFLGGADGAYAEYQTVDARIVARRPAPLSFGEAAAVPLAAGTAYELIVRRLAVAPGQRILIVGASGGVGTYAVQLAHGVGAHVVAVASEARHDALRELGADVALDYRHADLWQQVRRAGRIDAVVDLAGGEVPLRGVEVLAEAGALATVNTLSGDFELAVDKNLTLHGVLVRPEADRLRELASLVDRGVLRPIVSGEFALDDIVAAHRQIETGHTFGKLVVRVTPEPAA
ncbi:MAG TPA: NADP-dependent oxidoreductase [Solirubrobacteraceae bacterium]|nr:NADP-dependent oxidoreductase [Solirubrobacteraceae bacterium]